VKFYWLRKDGFPCVLSVCGRHFLAVGRLGFQPPSPGYGGGPPLLCDVCPGHEYERLLTACPTCGGTGLSPQTNEALGDGVVE
jgi:hypothetical protein